VGSRVEECPGAQIDNDTIREVYMLQVGYRWYE
jgi:hypothetical protein